MSIRAIRLLRLVSKKSTRRTRCFPTQRSGASTILRDFRISSVERALAPGPYYHRAARLCGSNGLLRLLRDALRARQQTHPDGHRLAPKCDATPRNTSCAARREHRAAHRNLATRRLRGNDSRLYRRSDRAVSGLPRHGLHGQRVCATCGGTGTTSRTRKLEVQIPPGVDTGSKVRVKGLGNPARAAARQAISSCW